MIFSLPFQIPGQNKRERWHWRKQRREVKSATYLVSLMMAQLRIPVATGPRLIRIVSYRRQRFHDHANLVGGCKGLVDGMVKAGLLIDDKDTLARFEYTQATLSLMPEWVREQRGETPCTTIEVIEQTTAQAVANPTAKGTP